MPEEGRVRFLSVLDSVAGVIGAGQAELLQPTDVGEVLRGPRRSKVGGSVEVAGHDGGAARELISVDVDRLGDLGLVARSVVRHSPDGEEGEVDRIRSP